MTIDSSTSLPALKKGIEDAFNKAKSSGERDGANSSQIITQLAQDISSAINSYIIATNITITVSPGQSVATSSGAGSTTTPGTGH